MPFVFGFSIGLNTLTYVCCADPFRFKIQVFSNLFFSWSTFTFVVDDRYR
jgi:hypothetical protein